jgi:uncharacterized membrane protein YhaH (DUF805 family)
VTTAVRPRSGLSSWFVARGGSGGRTGGCADGGPVAGLTGLALLVPQVSGMVTRLHDRDHSAWWLLWSLLPVIGWVILVVTVCFLGTLPTGNQYGPPPR